MRRIMFKISGEAMSGEKEFGFDDKVLNDICEQIKLALKEKIEVSVLLGGGNFIRGRDIAGIDKYRADQIGMLSTVMNGIYFKELLKQNNIKSSLYSSFKCDGIVDLFDKDNAEVDLKNGVVVLFVGGTGHPYFTTDTGVVLRALELDCTEVLLAKSIDAVYDDDPKINKSAKRYDKITYDEILNKNLKVVDLSSITLAKDNNLKLHIFSLNENDAIKRAMLGEKIGTIICGG